ncbi:MAG: nucleotidyl transferase AbiEii/AbiGii toxin family protein, partial [Syntrophales bacterium]|nr:nucleotidyl transferase AbiEii/AbiGii toxin family protein [Syntrophales bacterium]
RYRYPLLRPLVKTEYVDLLSLEDIAAMKMIAIVQRGTKRDFIDVYYLLKNISLERLFDLTQAKYKVFNKYIGLRALAYFNDAEKEKSGRGRTTFEKIDWAKIKKRIIDMVDKYRKEELLEQ